MAKNNGRRAAVQPADDEYEDIQAGDATEFYEEEQPKRGVFYWILFAFFRAPGRAINWVNYMNPKSGDVMGSRRRYGNPVSEVVESLVFWAVIIGGILLWLWYRQKI